MEVIYSTIGEVLVTARDIPFSFETSIKSMDINLPMWVYGVILVIVLVVVIVVVVALLPVLVMLIVRYVVTYMVFAIGTPIFYPGWTMWDLFEKSRMANDPVILMELFRPFVPWMLVTSSTFYIIGIPTLTFIYLRWIGFYKRIPKSWVNLG